jgi:hypothetical protein
LSSSTNSRYAHLHSNIHLPYRVGAEAFSLDGKSAGPSSRDFKVRK